MIEGKKQFNSTNLTGSPGYFALEKTPLAWENCRERFAKVFTVDLEGFYFKHEAGRSPNVAAFVRKTKTILKQQEFTKFWDTNRDTILWLEPSMFWKSCQMRRSLLTVLLRCAMLYEPAKDNYEEALFAQEYIVPTKNAIMRFLFGFTDYTGPDLASDTTIQVKGWKTIFAGKSEADIKGMLVWPTADRYNPSVELDSGLWF